MNEWNKPSEKKPPQGKKVLCMRKGDFYVAQRFKDYWFSIPFADSKYAFFKEPELWQDINFPDGYTGFMKILVSPDDYILRFEENPYKEINVDELEKHDPDAFYLLIESLKKSFEIEGDE